MLKRTGGLLNQISECSQPDVVETEKKYKIKHHILTKGLNLSEE